jgi:cytochrome c
MIKTLVTLFLISLSTLSNAQSATSKAILDTSTEAVDLQVLTSADSKIPNVPFKYGLGRSKFSEMCSSCHGEWGDGTEQGPPLMHPFYKPGHHSDSAFYRAVLNGVNAHHWNFGNMPPVAGATSKDVDAILPFIRWLQQEKKIY